MASRTVNDTETILADLELTRGLMIQMTAIGTLGMIVGWAVFSSFEAEPPASRSEDFRRRSEGRRE